MSTGATRAALAAALVSVALTAGCATPRPGLWPPARGPLTRTIFISVDTWHAMIAFPLEPDSDGGGSGVAPPGSERPSFEEWGYAERGWYLEGRQGVSGALRALFWPSAGIVEVTISDRVWAERTPQPPAELFRFQLSETGYQRLRHHLLETLAAREPVIVVGTSRFYPARDAYHLLHNCHHYTARALQEAGLPVSALAAFSRSSFAWQLRRAASIGMRTPPFDSHHGAPAPGSAATAPYSNVSR